MKKFLTEFIFGKINKESFDTKWKRSEDHQLIGVRGQRKYIGYNPLLQFLVTDAGVELKRIPYELIDPTCSFHDIFGINRKIDGEEVMDKIDQRLGSA